MAVKPPSVDELEQVAKFYRMPIPRSQLEEFRKIIEPLMAAYQRLDELKAPSPEVRYPDRKNWRPSDAENSLGAWYWRCEIKGVADGPLHGKTFAIKDNVCVAGVPMMNGSKLIEGFVPPVDATIVTRILDAGGTILGKSVCEDLCFSGNSHTSRSGVVRNPHDLARSPGGSSTGSGALVAAGDVDMAIGCDQAGSVRIPSSWSGIVGLKPTWGLIPYTGICGMELTIDHTGPMARSVADVALLLETLAGPDGLDPRQDSGLVGENYSASLNGNVKGLKIGIVREGFGLQDSQKDVDEAVREQAHALAKLGLEVKDASVPMHRDGLAIWTAIGSEGVMDYMIDGFGSGRGWKGYYPEELMDKFGRALNEQAGDLSPSVKMATMIGRYMNDKYHGHYYAKAQNLSRSLAASYNDALRGFDALVWPTTPMKAQEIPAPDAPLDVKIRKTIEMIPNTCPLNITGHPALTIPCAMSEGLPVGMMLVGKMADEATILRIADAFQRGIFATPAPSKKK